MLAAVTVGLTLYVPILVGDAIDCIVEAGKVDFAAILPILIRIAVVVGITALTQWLSGVINNRITYRVVQDIRADAFRKIQVLPLSYIDSHAHGDTVSRVITDVDQFADGLLMGFTQLFSGVVTILATIGFMLSVNPLITLVVVLATPLSLFVARFIARRTGSLFRRQSELRGEQTAFLNEMLQNQKVVKAFSHEKENEAQLRRAERPSGGQLPARGVLFLSGQSLHALPQQYRLCHRCALRRVGLLPHRRRGADGRRAFLLSLLCQSVYQALQRDQRRRHGAAKRLCLRRAHL